jgi:hypothetical protein
MANDDSDLDIVLSDVEMSCDLEFRSRERLHPHSRSRSAGRALMGLSVE